MVINTPLLFTQGVCYDDLAQNDLYSDISFYITRKYVIGFGILKHCSDAVLANEILQNVGIYSNW